MLLCRQEVRRSMVFSAVQISMPGMSCAKAPGAKKQGEIIIIAAHESRTIMSSPRLCPSYEIAGEPKDTTLKPHSHGEVSTIATVRRLWNGNTGKAVGTV
jgi:hypothetical protein